MLVDRWRNRRVLPAAVRPISIGPIILVAANDN